MIGTLPKKLNVNGIERAIRSDFRIALVIFQALSDSELSLQEKSEVLLECLYENYEDIAQADYVEAYAQAVIYLDGGNVSNVDNTSEITPHKLYDWTQDEQMIFSAVNTSAGFEVREKEYLHWWTFLGYFSEIGETQFSYIVSIRNKIAKRMQMDKAEKEFYRKNKGIVDLKQVEKVDNDIDFFQGMLNNDND